MNEQEFFALWNECSGEVADHFYPKVLPDGPNEGRGDFLRDQAVLGSKVLDRLKEKGVVT